LVVGHLNILTITFVPMLIGIAIDFGVHLISRYEEELRHGRSEREALEKALVNTGQGVFTGCFTTAGAFFAMALTDFKGIQEMGIITGGGMIICLVPMVTILPVLLLRGRQNQLDHLPSSAGQERRARIENLWLERPKVVLFVTAGLCLFCLARFPGVYFDYNLLHMQSAGLPAVVFEKKLVDTADKSVLYAAVVANSLPEAIALEAKLTNLTTVAGVDSMAHFLAEDQTRKLALIGRIKQELASLNFAPLDTRPVNVRDLSQTLTYLDGYATLILEDVKKRADDPELLKSVTGLKRAVQELAGRVANGDRARASVKLAAYQQALFQDIHDTFSTIKAQDNSAPLQPADLPAPLRNRFIGITGKHLLQVNPKKDVWQRENQEAFITEVRTVDPEVTGTPVQLYEYTGLLKDSYIQAAWYALGAIVILVFLHFRSPATVLLSLLPVAIGTIWMVGFMGWTGIPFNPANIMTLPLVIGIGVTNGIHILNRYAEEKNPSILAKSTGKAVFVSALTTIAGFGSLILAKHQGIQSLGAVMAVGTATCMVASLTFLPALLNLTGGMSKQKTQ
ncbi:MAG TPA: MMPL family transporter, partial [Verrucomicrobiae bacterium]|nr:MMPL family transporter [Verrucomicrobiae bacterium]